MATAICSYADAYNNRVLRFSPDSEFQWEFESFVDADSGEEDELDEPRSVCAAGAGGVAIADSNLNRIVTIDGDRNVTQVFEPDGLLEFPSEVRVGPDGTLFVADHANLRVQRFAADGRVTGVIDLRRAGSHDVSGGGDIEVDDEGHIIMIDPLKEAVVVLGFVAP